MALIHEKICEVMNECGSVAKNDTNPQQKYKYRGIDAVMNALNPAMRKAKLFVVPKVQELKREERAGRNGGCLIYSIVSVLYTFYAEDGSSLECIVQGEAMDSGDKSINKAMSAAFKYACFQTFCIPTEEMHDSEADSPEVAPKNRAHKGDGADTKEYAQPITASQVDALKKMLADKEIDEGYVLSNFKIKDFSELMSGTYMKFIKNLNHVKECYDRWRQEQGSQESQETT